jgi:hypothetical protein
MGYDSGLERYTMRKMIVGNQYSYSASMGLFSSGFILDEGCYFFCQPEVAPKYGDLIYDFNNATCGWECYEVSKVLERRYDNRVLFYTCACRIKEGSDT